jgi:hypothetical protein
MPRYPTSTFGKILFSRVLSWSTGFPCASSVRRISNWYVEVFEIKSQVSRKIVRNLSIYSAVAVREGGPKRAGVPHPHHKTPMSGGDGRRLTLAVF